MQQFLAYMHLRYFRTPFSRLMRFCKEREYRGTEMPVVASVTDIRDALRQVKWTQDIFGDYTSSPEKVWATKEGDCEDFARLACRLLRQIDLEGIIFYVMTEPGTGSSHAICAFYHHGSGGWSYFSNAIYKSMPSHGGRYRDIVRMVAGPRAKILAWSMEVPEKGIRMSCHWGL